MKFSGDIWFFVEEFLFLRFLCRHVVYGSYEDWIIVSIIFFGLLVEIVALSFFYRCTFVGLIFIPFKKVLPVYGIYFNFFFIFIINFYLLFIKKILFHFYNISFLNFQFFYFAILIFIFYLILMYYFIRYFILFFYPAVRLKYSRLIITLDEYFILFFLFFVVLLCCTNSYSLIVYLNCLFAFSLVYFICFLTSPRFLYYCEYIKKDLLPFHDYYYYFVFYLFYLFFLVFFFYNIFFVLNVDMALYILIFIHTIFYECNKECILFLKYLRRDLDSCFKGYHYYRILFLYYLVLILAIYIFINYGTIYESLGFHPSPPVPSEQDFIDFLVRYIPDYEELLDDAEIRKKLDRYVEGEYTGGAD